MPKEITVNDVKTIKGKDGKKILVRRIPPPKDQFIRITSKASEDPK